MKPRLTRFLKNFRLVLFVMVTPLVIALVILMTIIWIHSLWMIPFYIVILAAGTAWLMTKVEEE